MAPARPWPRRCVPVIWVRCAAAAAAAALAGCAFFDDDPQPPCPRVLVVAEAEEVSQFRPGPGRDLTDIQFEAKITGLKSGCEYHEEGFVDVGANIVIALSRGPAAEGDVGHFEYFVAITDPRGTIIAKRVFALDLEFPGGAPRGAIADDVTQRIFFAPFADASLYRVLIGFQLTRDQIDYLRRRQ